MVRVLHVINGADVGGISTMILNYYRHINRQAVHFDFVSADQEQGYNGKELEKLGSKFYYIEKKSNGLWKHMKALNKLMKEEQFDAVHVHSNHTSYVALIVAWTNHIKIRFAHGHNAVKNKLPFRESLSRRIGIILIKLFATKRLACSKDAAIYTFGKHSLGEKTLEILPNAIDVEKFRFNSKKRVQYRNEFGIKNEDFVVGCVGRMSTEKNHIFLVEMMPSLLKKIPNVCLMLVGDGDEKKQLEQRAKELNIEKNVVFTGSRSDVADLLSSMDVFVLPSIYEGFPIAAIEALANGLPVILSDTITRELDFTDSVSYISLKDSCEDWTDLICAKRKNGHLLEQSETVIEQGYDIHFTTQQLVRFYLEKA